MTLSDAAHGCTATGQETKLSAPTDVVVEPLPWAERLELPGQYIMVRGAGKWLRAGYEGDPQCTALETA